MELKTFDTILTELCDNFDELISPKAITRSNSNIIYLLFKAIAKGFEVINSTCVVLSNKFNPTTCTVEDLESVATLVGTERQAGSATGLHIVITNNNEIDSVTLLAGNYYYALDDDTIFNFEVLSDTVIDAEEYITVIAMSENIGSYSVTEQSSITVTSEQEISSSLSFSCKDNSNLLGTSEETDLEYRKRILEGYDNQNNIIELQNKLKALPYLFDCRVKYNGTTESVTYNDIVIPPFSCAIFYSGAIKTDIAEVIASKILCPTVKTDNSIAVTYTNESFINNSYTFNLIPFAKTNFSIQVKYKINSQYANEYDIKTTIKNALTLAFISEVHTDYIKENDVYNTIEDLSLTGIELLDVNLLQNSQEVSYIEVPLSNIPYLEEVTFIKEE